ncbi:MAG: hypothetical protein IAC58_00645 [Firmicutes bacterium]|uniref:Uncharacterized protein n=1 Tax=Candidatus Onthovivens merdipullorum TaxID=2840889 RepID=A0A9D9GWZ4_9BACL|nr:hypothetical protein [Candidatus Onthovivens merdipullorum]
MRRKIYDTVDKISNNVKLRGRVWIDEFYIKDPRISYKDGETRKRGLSKDQICIAVAVDQYMQIFLKRIGNGHSSARKIYKAFKNIIEQKSPLIHIKAKIIICLLNN